MILSSAVAVNSGFYPTVVTVTVRFVVWVGCVCLCVTLVCCGCTRKWTELVWSVRVTTEDSYSVLNWVRIRKRQRETTPTVVKAYVHGIHQKTESVKSTTEYVRP